MVFDAAINARVVCELSFDDQRCCVDGMGSIRLSLGIACPSREYGEDA
jgi:hypothetical protein